MAEHNSTHIAISTGTLIRVVLVALGVLLIWVLRDVILVGHSYGGMVITGAADRAHARIRRLVYLDAFVPENGKCALDYVVPERAARMREEGEKVGSITPPPLSNCVRAGSSISSWVV